MPKNKIEIEVDIPEGYEFVGYRYLSRGDYWISGGVVEIWTLPTGSINKHIVVKKKQWRAVSGAAYYTGGITPLGNTVIHLQKDLRIAADNARYGTGNYFPTSEECGEAWDKISKYAREVLQSD